MSILLEEALAILHVGKLVWSICVRMKIAWACYNLSMCSLEASSTVKNILFDRKITFFAITIYFAEHDHRLKIENVVVADQVLINAFAIVACWCRCDTTTSPFFVFDKLEHFVMQTNSRSRIYIKWGLINKDVQFYYALYAAADVSLRLSFQRVFNFRGTPWNIDKCVTVAYWSRLVNVYPETSFKSLSNAIFVLHYSLRQYSQYTVIGRTALVTSQIQGKWLAATEIKGDKQDNK